MGSVWSATHTITGGRVALKFVKGADTSPDMRRRIHREARAATLVEHPNVVTIRDVFDHDDVPVLVMDLLNGETLADRLARIRRLEIGDAARIALAVIAAVGAAHEIGMIHRDLKPENVFLARSTHGEAIRVLDFGIAKIVRHNADEIAASAVTQSGALVGTPAYMAPEQLFGERDLDHRVDVWALGVMIYEMLVGERPIDGENFGQIAKRLLTQKMPTLGEQRPDVPEDVVALVDHMLAREREDRLADLREAADILAKHASQPRPSFGAPKPPRPQVDSDQGMLGENTSDAKVVVSVADPSAPTQVGPAVRRASKSAETLVSSPSSPSNASSPSGRSRPSAGTIPSGESGRTTGPTTLASDRVSVETISAELISSGRPRQDTEVPHVAATRTTTRSRAPLFVVLAGLVVVGAGAVSIRALTSTPAASPIPSGAAATATAVASTEPHAVASTAPSAEPAPTQAAPAKLPVPPASAAPSSAPVAVIAPTTTAHPGRLPKAPATTLPTASAKPTASATVTAAPPPPQPTATATGGSGLVTKPPF